MKQNKQKSEKETPFLGMTYHPLLVLSLLEYYLSMKESCLVKFKKKKYEIWYILLKTKVMSKAHKF